MLKNFVVDADLKAYYPNLTTYLWIAQADYSTQILEAFQLILDELRAREINPRNMGKPLDLGRAVTSSDLQHTLDVAVETSNTTSTHINAIEGFNRFVINVTVIVTGAGETYSIKLQGSNDVGGFDAAEPANWADIKTITPIATGETTVVFENEFKYYRYVNTVSGGAPSLTYTRSIVETFHDRWIIHRAVSLIASAFRKEGGDMWDLIASEAMVMFNSALSSYKFSLDVNDDNLITDADGDLSKAPLVFWR